MQTSIDKKLNDSKELKNTKKSKDVEKSKQINKVSKTNKVSKKNNDKDKDKDKDKKKKKKNVKKNLIINGSNIKTIEINSKFKVDDYKEELILKLFSKKGRGKIERHCCWELEKFNVSTFGWKDGKAGKENKLELPPPEDVDIYFGDILFIASNKKGETIDFTNTEYEYFLNETFGGFDSIGSEDSWSEEEIPNEEDKQFIVNSDEEIEYEDSTSKSESEFDSEYYEEED